MKKTKDIRTLALIGDEAFEKLNSCRITIVGLGGVGGIASEMLVRAGVSHLKLIDFDVFDASNRNRQLGALISTEGRKKVEVFKERFLDIDEDAEIETIAEPLTNENVEEFLKNSDYIIDMCDDVDAKCAIIKYSVDNKIPFMSAMGAGNRTDISKLFIKKLSKTSYCPLAKKLRQNLPKKYQYKTKVTYYEGETVSVDKNLGFVGTISYSPNFMGIKIVSEVISDIIKR